MSSSQIDAYLAKLPPWQRDNLTKFRRMVHRVVPAAEEGWKWDVPVFLVHGRLVCAMSAFTGHTKYNFFNGAALADPAGLFNSGLESKRSRSVNLAQGETVDSGALEELVRAAAGFVSAASR